MDQPHEPPVPLAIPDAGIRVTRLRGHGPIYGVARPRRSSGGAVGNPTPPSSPAGVE